MNLTEAITTTLPRHRWGEAWLSLREHTGRVSPALVRTASSYTAIARHRSWSMRNTNTGVHELDWIRDRDVVHLFEVRDELPQYEEHMGSYRWDHFIRKYR